ncbi:hypothetical protein CHS0354_021507 [Potamilus streckersoni]|uniref:Uncharacterized protein n=1 Tax=Potamilus streckersoni TaxID=2493646 RepID=A0AAE0VRT6_9BIVA|nr:hypothetical protein CHS0354_021507 [Potamilus streckersoni]
MEKDEDNRKRTEEDSRKIGLTDRLSDIAKSDSDRLFNSKDITESELLIRYDGKPWIAIIKIPGDMTK